MSKILKAGTWRGRFYLRNKQIDKHGNKYKSTPTWRQTGSGIVVDKYGNFLGYEKPLHHKYGRDEKGKKPKGWHGESVRHALARQGIRTKR